MNTKTTSHDPILESLYNGHLATVVLAILDSAGKKVTNLHTASNLTIEVERNNVGVIHVGDLHGENRLVTNDSAYDYLMKLEERLGALFASAPNIADAFNSVNAPFKTTNQAGDPTRMFVEPLNYTNELGWNNGRMRIKVGPVILTLTGATMGENRAIPLEFLNRVNEALAEIRVNAFNGEVKFDEYLNRHKALIREFAELQKTHVDIHDIQAILETMSIVLSHCFQNELNKCIGGLRRGHFHMYGPVGAPNNGAMKGYWANLNDPGQR